MNLEIDFGGIKLKNPVTVASGTFGYGREFSDFYDLGKIIMVSPSVDFTDINFVSILKRKSEK